MLKSAKEQVREVPTLTPIPPSLHPPPVGVQEQAIALYVLPRRLYLQAKHIERLETVQAHCAVAELASAYRQNWSDLNSDAKLDT